MTHKLEITLLGTLTITVNGKPIEVASNFVRALLLFLVIEVHQPHRREVLAEMLWPGKPEGAARNSLKQALSNLRMALGDRDSKSPFLLVSGNEIQFNQSRDYWVDSEAFAEILETCAAHEHDDLASCQSCLDCYLRTFRLYQGDFLAGFYLPDNQDFNDWVTLKREVLQRCMSDALSKLVWIYEKRGEFANAIEYSQQLSELEPWNEENHRSLMHLLALNGLRTAALRQYQVCCENLQRELDVEPSNATTALYHEIKAWEPDEFPDQEQPIFPGVPGNSEMGPETVVPEKPILRRKLTRLGFVWLMIAGLILVMGSVYWAGLPDFLAMGSDYVEQVSEEVPITADSSIQVLPSTTIVEAINVSSLTTQTPTEVLASRATPSQTDMDASTSLKNPEGRERDLQALSAVYAQTNGPGWINVDGWLSDLSPCDWYGVTCRGERIVALELDHNQLDGTIPAEIGQLADLENLNLGNNQLRGMIPPQIGSLSNLVYLTLWGNRELSGSIPPELGNLSNLEFLELAHWESGGSLLSGEIPPELGNLSKLRYLSISVSLLSGPLPNELCGLSNLEDLYLDSNRLSGPIPPEIGNMTSLGALDLGGNDFEGPIPSELGNLPMLDYLALGGSLVSGEIPAELGNMLRLRHLVLDNTDLSGPLPLTLMNLNLRTLIYFGTGVCEPEDEVFQVWLAGINEMQGTGVVCKPEGY